MNEIFDIHVHMGSSSGLYVEGNGDICISRMDEHQVTGAAISPIPGYEDPNGFKDTNYMNRQMAEQKAKCPDRYVVAFGVVEPKHGYKAMDEVDFALGELSLDGIMFHNDFNGVEVDTAVMHDIFKRIEMYKNRVVMIHTAFHSDLEPPFMVGRIAEAFPEQKIVLGHPFMTVNQTKAVIELLKQYETLFVDTCYTFHHGSLLERIVGEIGSHRIIFGTDNPYYGSLCVDKLLVENADIAVEDKKNIFSRNFKILFGTDI